MAKFSAEILSPYLLNNRERTEIAERGYVFRDNMIILSKGKTYSTKELVGIMEKYCKQFSIKDADTIKKIAAVMADVSLGRLAKK